METSRQKENADNGH